MIKGPFPSQLSGKYFMLEILTTTPNETFTLPLNSSGSYNFTANWGDGTADSIITAYNDPDITHTFSSAGTHIISMKGICTIWRWDITAGDRAKVRRILDFTDMGFTILNFCGCVNLTFVSKNMKLLTHLTTAGSMFQSCTSLTSIPEGIFSGSTGITNCNSVFMYCPITSISEDIFKYNINVTTFYQAFNHCDKLTSIPANLFKYNTKITVLSHMLYYCTSLTSIPAHLFDTNTLVTTFETTFAWCTNITSIPADLFKYNTKVTTFSSTFSNIGSLTSIPEHLFDTNTKVTIFNYTFSSCYYLASIPDNLFRYNILAINFNATFNNCNKLQHKANIFWADGERDTRFLNQSVIFTTCFKRVGFTGLQGTSPDLWNCDFGTGTPTKTSCFAGAGNSTTSLTNYNDIPVDWK